MPLNAVFAPDGKYAYVSCWYGGLGLRGALVQIDTASQTVVGNIALAKIGSPLGSTRFFGFGIALDPATKNVYVTQRPKSTPHQGECKLAVINPPHDHVKSHAFIPNCLPNPIAFTPDGQYLYIVATDARGTNSTVLTIETATNQVVGTPIVVGVEANPLAIAPNGKFAYVVNTNGFVTTNPSPPLERRVRFR